VLVIAEVEKTERSRDCEIEGKGCSQVGGVNGGGSEIEGEGRRVEDGDQEANKGLCFGSKTLMCQVSTNNYVSKRN